MEVPQTLEKRPDPLRDGSVFSRKALKSAAPTYQGNRPRRVEDGVHWPTPLSAGHSSYAGIYSPNFGQYVSPSPRAAEFAAFNRSEAARQIRTNFESLVRASPNPRALERLELQGEARLALPWHSTAGVQDLAVVSTPAGHVQNPTEAWRGNPVKASPHSTPQGHLIRPTPHTGNGTGFATPDLRPLSGILQAANHPSQPPLSAQPGCLSGPWGAPQSNRKGGSATGFAQVDFGLPQSFREESTGAIDAQQGLAVGRLERQTDFRDLPLEPQQQTGRQYTPSLRDPRLQSGLMHRSAATPVAPPPVQGVVVVKERAPSPPMQSSAADSLEIGAQEIGPLHHLTSAAGPSGLHEEGRLHDQGIREPHAAEPSAEEPACNNPSACSDKQRPPLLMSSVRQKQLQSPNMQSRQQAENLAETPSTVSASGPPSGQPSEPMGLLSAKTTCEPGEAAPSSAPGPLSRALVIASPLGLERLPGRASNALQVLPQTADRRPEERTFGGRFKQPIGAATLALPASTSKPNFRHRRCRSMDPGMERAPLSSEPAREAHMVAEVPTAQLLLLTGLEDPAKTPATSNFLPTSSCRRVTRSQRRQQQAASAHAPAERPTDVSTQEQEAGRGGQPPLSTAAEPETPHDANGSTEQTRTEPSDVPDASLSAVEGDLSDGAAAEALASLGEDPAVADVDVPSMSGQGPPVQECDTNKAAGRGSGDPAASTRQAASPRRPADTATDEHVNSPQPKAWGGAGRRSQRSSCKKKPAGVEAGPVEASTGKLAVQSAKRSRMPSGSNKEDGADLNVAAALERGAEEPASTSGQGVSSPPAARVRKVARGKGRKVDAAAKETAPVLQLPVSQQGREVEDEKSKLTSTSAGFKAEVSISGVGTLQVSRTGRVRAPPMAFWANQRLCRDPTSHGGPVIHQEFVDQLAMAGRRGACAPTKAGTSQSGVASPAKSGKGASKASKPLPNKPKGGISKPTAAAKKAANKANKAASKASASSQIRASKPDGSIGGGKRAAHACPKASLAVEAIRAGREAAAASRIDEEGQLSSRPSQTGVGAASFGSKGKSASQAKAKGKSGGVGEPSSKLVSSAQGGSKGQLAMDADMGDKRPREEDPPGNEAVQEPAKKQRAGLAQEQAGKRGRPTKRCAACAQARKGYCGTPAAIPGCLRRAAAGSAASVPPRPDAQAQVTKPAAAKSRPVQKKQLDKSKPAGRAAKAAGGPSASGTDAANAQAEHVQQKADVLEQNPALRPSVAAEPSQGREGGIAQAEEVACSSDDDDPGQALEEEDSSWSSQQVHALKAALAVHVDPTAPSFWQKVADCVPGKSASECNAKFFEHHPTPKPAKPSRLRRSASGSQPALSKSKDFSRGLSKKPTVVAARKIAREARWRQRIAAAPVNTARNVMVTGAGDGADPFLHLIDLQGAKERQARADKYIDALLSRRGHKRGWAINQSGGSTGTQGHGWQGQQPSDGSQLVKEIAGLVANCDDQEVDEESDRDHYFSDESE